MVEGKVGGELYSSVFPSRIESSLFPILIDLDGILESAYFVRGVRRLPRHDPLGYFGAWAVTVPGGRRVVVDLSRYDPFDGFLYEGEQVWRRRDEG